MKMYTNDHVISDTCGKSYTIGLHIVIQLQSIHHFQYNSMKQQKLCKKTARYAIKNPQTSGRAIAAVLGLHRDQQSETHQVKQI